MSPDEFFTADQQQRLGQLMAEWRAARDGGHDFPKDLQVELERLVETELLASANRAKSRLRR